MGDGYRRRDQGNRELASVGNREIKNLVSPKVFYCKICDVHCTSEMNLKMHFLGLKHRRNDETIKNVPGPKGHSISMGDKDFNSDKRKVQVPTIDARHAFGSSLLERHLREVGSHEPLIGLNYVIEHQTEGLPDPVFFCELCSSRGAFASFMSHLLGFKHRLNYVAKLYPDALQLDGVRLKQSEFNALVKEKARFIEKIDGRGKVKVVLSEAPNEFAGGNTAVKRPADNYGQSDSGFRENLRSSFSQNMNAASSSSYDPRLSRSHDGQSRHENFGSSFGQHVKMESSNAYDARMLQSHDDQLDNKYSRHENFGSTFGQPVNMGSSSAYESRMPYSQGTLPASGEDWKILASPSAISSRNFLGNLGCKPSGPDYRSTGDVMQDDWRKKIKSEETLNMDWSRDNIRDSGDDYRRGELTRSYPNDCIKGSDVDDRWMESELEPLRSDDPKPGFTNEEIFDYLQTFQITSDSDASFALKVTQTLTDGLMEYRLKTMTGLNQEKKPPLDEEMRRPTGIAAEHSRYESLMSRPDMPRPDMPRPDMPRPDLMRPDLMRPDLMRPDLMRPDMMRPDMMRPDMMRPDMMRPDMLRPAALLHPTLSRPALSRPAPGGGAWKKAVALHAKTNNKKPGFPSNRRLIKPPAFNTGLSKYNHGGILTPQLLKAVRGMDMSKATKTLTKLSKTNPALKGIKVSVLVDVLVEAGVLK